MLRYATQNPAVLIGSRNTTTDAVTGATLTNYYDLDGLTTKIFETGEATKIELDCVYEAGAGETANSVQVIIESSPDRTNWYRLLNESVSDGTSTLTQREFTITQTTTYGKLAYDAQSDNFTVGLLVTGAGGATGIIESDTDAGTTGTLTLSNISGTFVDNENLTDSGTGAAVVNGVLTSVTRFSLPVDISNRYTRVSFKETGVASNYGTIFVEGVVNTK